MERERHHPEGNETRVGRDDGACPADPTDPADPPDRADPAHPAWPQHLVGPDATASRAAARPPTRGVRRRRLGLVPILLGAMFAECVGIGLRSAAADLPCSDPGLVPGIAPRTAVRTETAAEERDPNRPLSWSEWRQLAPLVDDAELASWLLDDSIRWNATAAAEELFRRIGDPDRYRGAVSALWPLLEGDDWQATKVAAGLLQKACLEPHPGQPPVVPDERLIELSVQWALIYRGGVDWGALHGELGPMRSVRFVSKYAREAAPRLVEAVRAHRDGKALLELESVPAADSNWRLRDFSWPHFMGAYLLSFAPGAIPVEEAAVAIIPHLHENHSRYDALMGLAALARYGPSAAGACRKALADSTDDQQRACLEMLLAHWDWPEDSALRQEALDRLRGARLTWKVVDPILEWDFELQTW